MKHPLSTYKKLRKEGGSRVLAVGQFLPLEWSLVRLEVVKSRVKDCVTLRIYKAS